MGVKKLVKQVLVNKCNGIYQKELEKRQCSYHAWITGVEAGYSASAVAGGNADSFWLICNPKGRMAQEAKSRIAEWFAGNPEAVLCYGDEDVWAEGQNRTSPCFKPDWSPDLFEQRFYLGGLVAVRKDWLETQAQELVQPWELADGGLATEEECKELVIKTVKLAGGFEKESGRKHILHIPKILFHNQSKTSQWDFMEYGEEEGIWQEQADLTGVFLSVIIPSKDNPELLEKCIGSVMACTSQIPYEIIVVDNGSEGETRRQIEGVLHRFRQNGGPGFKRLLYHHDPMEFNFSKMCNRGVRKASGELLLFLNDDVTLAEEDTLEKMAVLAKRPWTGAVGLKLLYPENSEAVSRRIQHAGITNLPMGPVHKLQFCSDEKVYYMGRNRGRHNALAVTAACLMVEKSKFTEVGGFDEELVVAFNDVDLCYKLYEQGYENVCECDFYAYHDESYSRGDDESPEKLKRLLGERAKLYERHPDLEGKDPYYSAHLNRDGLDTRIRPAYEQGKNTIQQVSSGKGQCFELWEEAQWEEQLSRCREDACLMVRVESVLKQESQVALTGWSVVLGDNNACYDKKLVLKSEKGVYCLALTGQYRPDLMENMPDQTNVGLCGFRLEWEEGALPVCNYQVGVMALNRINGTGLINWSNRMVEV